NRLLEDARPDLHWLDAIEHETAELAVAVTALRVETVNRLQAALAARKDEASAFPAAEIALDGWMERLVPLAPAVEVEDRYRAVLRDNRGRDAAAGRTLDGPHLADLAVRPPGKVIAAPRILCHHARARTIHRGGMHARRLLRDQRNGPRRLARRRRGNAAAGTRRGPGASCRLRRQSFRCEEPRRLDAQDRIPARH